MDLLSDYLGPDLVFSVDTEYLGLRDWAASMGPYHSCSSC